MQLLFFIISLIATVRSAHLLVYDHLDPKRELHSFITVSPFRTCAHYNESYYPYTSASEKAKHEIYKRLECCRETSNCDDYKYYYIDNKHAKGKHKKCKALDMATGKIAEISCTGYHPSLCTNSAPKVTHDKGFTTEEKYLHTIHTKFGRLVGTRSQVTFAFLGIPYAQPPLGELRFEDPVCLSKIEEKWDATRFRSYCPQDNATIKDAILNENCLYLNIFTPYLPDAGDKKKMRLPVFFWIHGGSFMRGDPGQPYNNPSHLASSQSVVVVTINYRLGTLGFWGSRNQAIKDQYAALEWVSTFIEDFGGDPNKITIGGESAGANSVRALLTVKKASGLFRGAFLASDPIGVGFSTRGDAENILTRELAKGFGCMHGSEGIYDKEVMDCMRKVPLDVMVQRQMDFSLLATFKAKSIPITETFKPVLDGSFIAGDLYDLMITGGFNKVPIMIGTLKDEGFFFTQDLSPIPIPTSLFGIIIGLAFPEQIVKLIKESGLYDIYKDKDKDGVRIALSEIMGDSHWFCPHQLVIAKLSSHTKVYGYTYKYPYTWLYNSSFLCHGYVCHADDLPAILGSFAIPGIETFYGNRPTDRSEDDITFTSHFMERLGSFIRTGDPNPPKVGHCYTKSYYEKDPKKITAHWKPFALDKSLGDIPTSFLNVSNGKVYGPLFVLDLAEQESSGPHGVNKTVCDFWYRIGIQAQTYPRDNNGLAKYRRDLLANKEKLSEYMGKLQYYLNH